MLWEKVPAKNNLKGNIFIRGNYQFKIWTIKWLVDVDSGSKLSHCWNGNLLVNETRIIQMAMNYSWRHCMFIFSLMWIYSYTQKYLYTCVYQQVNWYTSLLCNLEEFKSKQTNKHNPHKKTHPFLSDIPSIQILISIISIH